jgi:hypothetical protein
MSGSVSATSNEMLLRCSENYELTADGTALLSYREVSSLTLLIYTPLKIDAKSLKPNGLFH